MLAETVGASTRAPRLSDASVHVGGREVEEVAVARDRAGRAARPARRRRGGPRKNVSGGCVGARGRGEAISTQRAAPLAAPGMRDADRDDAARVRAAACTLRPSSVEHRLALEDVEARLERVDVRVDVARPRAGRASAPVCVAPVSPPTRTQRVRPLVRPGSARPARPPRGGPGGTTACRPRAGGCPSAATSPCRSPPRPTRQRHRRRRRGRPRPSRSRSAPRT